MFALSRPPPAETEEDMERKRFVARRPESRADDEIARARLPPGALQKERAMRTGRREDESASRRGRPRERS